MRLTFKEISEQVKKIVPPHVKFDIEPEAANVALIGNSLEDLAELDGLAGKIANTVKRHVVIRPKDTLLLDEKESISVIKEIIPPEAGISGIHFDPCYCSVIISCEDPGTATGRRGINLKEIHSKIGWVVSVERTPSMQSRTNHDIREHRKKHAKERRSLLRDIGRSIYRPKRPGQSWVRVTALGSYREVGRACHLVTTNESRIIIDCGAKPGARDELTPFFTAPEMLPLESVDAVVITHAHLDHIGMLPILFKYGYSGPVYCTPPTRDLMTLLQQDFLKVAESESNVAPYSNEDIRKMINHVIDIDLVKTTDIAPDIKMTLHNAGHILGSTSVHLHVGEGLHNIVFSGDIKYEKSFLYNAASSHFPRVETLIMESTYGGANNFQPSREEATFELHETVKRVLSRGGKILFPVFAVGRSQEVMVALDRLFRSGDVEPVTVWLDGMIQEATAIHSCHPDYLNKELRKSVLTNDENNPFSSPWFKKVNGRKMRETILVDPSPCIVLATSGMMTGGPIVEYFKNWAPNDLNTLCFVGYQAEGTLGRRLQKGFSEVPLNDGKETRMVEVNCDLVTIDGFSGHSDRRQLMEYVGDMTPKPRMIICHHGDSKICAEFGKALREKYRIRTYAPSNLETLRLV